MRESWWCWYFFVVFSSLFWTCCWFLWYQLGNIWCEFLVVYIQLYGRLKYNKPQNVFNFYFTKIHSFIYLVSFVCFYFLFFSDVCVCMCMYLKLLSYQLTNDWFSRYVHLFISVEMCKSFCHVFLRGTELKFYQPLVNA